MNLLELTEKEVEFVRNALILARSQWDVEKRDYDDHQINADRANVILEKLENSLKPKVDVPITYRDLFRMIDMAKTEYLNLPDDLHISNKRIEKKDLVHIAVAKSAISWLNSKNLLKRLAVFDNTDKSCEYEENQE